MTTWTDETSAAETWTDANSIESSAHGFQFGAFQFDAFQMSAYYDAQTDNEVWTDL